MKIQMNIKVHMCNFVNDKACTEEECDYCEFDDFYCDGYPCCNCGQCRVQ